MCNFILSMSLEHFWKSWWIKKKDSHSSVYRYCEQKYIDEFFETGRLKLSTFKSNRIIEDGIRKDENEGLHTYRVASKDRKRVCELNVSDFDHRRIFCCSTQLDLSSLLTYFKVDGCFEITNSIGFAYEIALVLNGYHYGQEGPVEYTDDNFTYFLLEQHENLPDLPEDKNMKSFLPLIDAIGKDLNMFFHKRKAFSSEKEFRFVWKCIKEHPIFIDCPGALKYCKKIT